MQDLPFQNVDSKRRLSRSTPSGVVSAGFLFLREDEIRMAQDIIFFAARDLRGAIALALAEMQLTEAEYRVLYFVGRFPGLRVGSLLELLDITKQSLSQVLHPLRQKGYVCYAVGDGDRQLRVLTLTQPGMDLEYKLFEHQRERFFAAYREAGGPSVEGFRLVLGLLAQGQKYWAKHIAESYCPNISKKACSGEISHTSEDE